MCFIVLVGEGVNSCKVKGYRINVESAVVSMFGLLGVSSEGGFRGRGYSTRGHLVQGLSQWGQRGEWGIFIGSHGVLGFGARGQGWYRDKGSSSMGQRSVGLSHGEKWFNRRWEGLKICFQRLYGTGRTGRLPVQRITFRLSWERSNSIREEFGGRAEG